jgi:hypothetical protein
VLFTLPRSGGPVLQLRRAPTPPAGKVAVDGSDPEAVGVAWLPRTAVGDGEAPAVDAGVGLTPEVAVAPADEAGDGDCATGGDGAKDAPVEPGGALGGTVAEEVAVVCVGVAVA